MMDVEEYLRTSFDDADCEYLDGEIADRNAGAWPHAETMGTLCYLLGELRPRLGIRVAPVIRIRITPTRYRVADLAVWRDDNIGKRIPIVPPFLAIEILSPEDRILVCNRRLRNTSRSESNGSGSSIRLRRAQSATRNETRQAL